MSLYFHSPQPLAHSPQQGAPAAHRPTGHDVAMSGPRAVSRRVFFRDSSWLMAAVTGLGGGLTLEQAAADGGEGVVLRVDPEQQLFRVRLEIDVKGNVNVPDNPLVSRTRNREFPLTSRAAFDYEERQRLPEGAAAGSWVTAAERYYHQATSDSQLNRKNQQSSLRDSVRQTIVRRDSLPETVYAVDDYFTHQELDLLEVPVSSLAVDQLLPSESVSSGSKYAPSTEAIRSLLNLSSVEASEVEGEVTALSESEAKIRLEGNLTGSVDGVPTKLRLVAKLTFDRQLGFCNWLAMAVHETREIGRAKPGFDVAATIKLLRKPLSTPIALPADPRPLEITEPVPAARTLVALKSQEQEFSVLMDRRWRMMRDVPGSAMMRMIDQDRSIAQCDIRPLSVLPENHRWTLAALEQQLRRTLGSQLSEIVDAGEGVTESGLHGLQITANGQAEGVPIRWILIHLADEQGNRALATFTMDASVLEIFAGADVQFANSFEFTGSPRRTASPAGSGESSPGSGEAARRAGETADSGDAKAGGPQEATARLNENGRERVQSASDLK